MSEAWLEEWVAKAEEDRLAASSLKPAQTPGAVCFHCQQCIEKYLKAALVKHGEPVRQIHNLVVLSDLVAQHDPRFGGLTEALVIINPYSIAARYPGLKVTADDARAAVKVTHTLREQIRAFLGLPKLAPGRRNSRKRGGAG